MEVYHGMTMFHGIAIGKIQYYHKIEQNLHQYTIEKAKKELERFHQASRLAEADLRKLYQETIVSMGELQAQVIYDQLQVLISGSFHRAIESMILGERVTASYAIEATKDDLAETFADFHDVCARKRIDSLQGVSNRLISVLCEMPRESILGNEPVILVSTGLSPADLIELEKDKMLAIVTKEGSRFFHTTILAKTMNLPAVVLTEVDPDWNGRMAIVDGYEGVLYLDPDAEILTHYQEKRREEQEEQKNLLLLREAEDITADGKSVDLFANIGNLDDLDSVLQCGAKGIGLLRSEFQYLGRENYPKEDELYEVYCKVLETMKNRPVVIRTVDLGADKKSDYMSMQEETNPILGNRGIRFCLDRKKIFKTQLRALYRASVYGNLMIMYPMITSLLEVRQIQEIIKGIKEELDAKDIPYGKVKQGIMIETPAAAFISGELAKEVDFISLGTNDLTQYLLAMDRQNPLLKDKYDEHHPAVFRTIQMVVEESHKAGCKVTICGELAGETELVPTFLKMGVDALSVVPASVLPVRRAIREAKTE